MKKLILIILLWTSAAFAAPWLVSDPNDSGVTEYVLECGAFVSIIPAAADGSVYWDFDLWTGDKGWHDCTIKARSEYAVEDVTTGNITTVTKDSDPAVLRIKIAPPNSSANHMIQE